MTYDEANTGLRPVPSIDAVLAAHGAGKVLAVAVAALLRGRFRKARPPDARALSNHLRRDIGLPPAGFSARDPLL
jgi:hypothetical protein